MEAQSLQTKVVWSLDRSTLRTKGSSELLQAGFDVLRLVYGRGSGREIGAFLGELQSHPSAMQSPAVMIDVSHYHQATVTSLKLSTELQYGQQITLSSNSATGDVCIESPNWEAMFVKDSLVYVGFGAVVLKTISIESNHVAAQVVQSGSIRVGMNVFDAKTYKEPSVFDLTGVDISPFKERHIDYVVIPGISTAREVGLIRKRLSAHLKSEPWIIVRVDNKKVYEELESLLPFIDGVMIPRRELAVSLDPTLVPMVCKEIMNICHENAKLAMIESDFLSSMRLHPTPTRAEVSDIANAVIDGTDAIILAEDLGMGPHADRALKVCRSIIGDVENQEVDLVLNWARKDFVVTTEFDAVAYHAYKTAERVKAKAIVCITLHGNTAVRLASFRIPFPIIAVTFSVETQRRLSIVRGVRSLLLAIDPAIDQVLPLVKDKLRGYSWLTPGDSIVFVTVSLSPVGHEESNLFTVQTI